MKKGTFLLAALWCVAGAAARAQHPVADTVRFQDDNADFTFSESQLDEDGDFAQTISSVTAKSDPFLYNVGFRFSPMRFRVRAYDNMYANTYMNGLRLNDLELGRFNYASIGGLNDATRNREGLNAYDFSTFGTPGIGGATSYNTRASQFAQGKKLSLSATNRNYVGRALLGARCLGGLSGSERRADRGYVLQFGSLFPRCGKALRHEPCAFARDLRRADRTRATGGFDRRGLLVSQLALLQPELGLPERRKTQFARGARLRSHKYPHVGLEQRQQRHATDYELGLHLFVLQRDVAGMEWQCLRSATGLL